MNRWRLVAATGIAVFMAQLDVTVVNVVLPTIEDEFGAGPSVAEWVVLGYVLPLIALTLPAGRWLDQVGRREALAVSVAGFAAASVAVGLAPGIGWMIAARVVQGAFAAVLLALVPVLTTIAVRPEVRGRAMAVVMTLGPLGGVTGPALGGLLIEHLGWPWIFILNVPVSLLVIALGWTSLAAGDRPVPAGPDGPAKSRMPGRARLVETALLGGAAIALMLALSLGAGHGPGWLALAVAAVPLTMAWWRLPDGRPVRELLRAPGMSAPHLALMAEMAAVMSVQFLIPFQLQRSGTATPAEIGLTMLAFPAAVMVTGPIGGALADRFDGRAVAIAGAAAVTAGLVLLVPAGTGWGPADLAWRLAVAGAGAGLFAGPNQTIAMGRAPRHLLGTTGATTSLARQLGVALGPALATATWSLTGYGVDGMRAALGLAAVLGAVSVLVQVRGVRASRPVAEPAHITESHRV
ncbi:MFS transporter [Actinomadura sp. 1N219]|uniref:MFS transporter n=1 Tax=Actinomadura sp. 1N219 TaxID=3375152 RepID=UPI0037AEDCBB